MNLRLGILVGFGWLTSNLFTIAQTITERYDLQFQCTDACRSSWIDQAYHCRFAADTTIKRAGRYPLKITFDSIRFKEVSMRFGLNQFISLPDNIKGKEMRVILDYKAQQMVKLKFIASLFDSEEQKLCADTLILDNSEDWIQKTLTLPWSTEARAMKIRLDYSYNSHPDQKIWLGGINLELDGKNLGEKEWNRHTAKDSLQLLKRFDSRSICSISYNNVEEFPFSTIPDFEAKKVVGLGSFSLGSHETVRAMFQCCKELITHHRATWIMVEWPFDLSAVYDLYVQGLAPLEFEKHIRESLTATGWDIEMCLEFINWIRDYNQTAERKVHLVGIDAMILPFSNTFLYEYFETLLGEEKGADYLDLIRKRRYKKLTESIRNNQELKNFTGEDMYWFLSYFLSGYTSVSLEMSGYNNTEIDRDREMINHYLNLVRQVKENEKCVILGHHTHIARDMEKLWGPTFTMGVLLNYEEKVEKSIGYYAISFQSGSGSVRQQDCANSGLTYVKPLPPAPYNSFESIALAAGPDYFFYPTQYLNENILQLLSLPTYSDPPYGYITAFPQQWFDAIVFVKESTPTRVSPDQPAKAKAYLEKRSRPVAGQ